MLKDRGFKFDVAGLVEFFPHEGSFEDAFAFIEGLIGGSEVIDREYIDLTARKAINLEQATKIRELARSREFAGVYFHQILFRNLAFSYAAENVLNWAFSDDGFPFDSSQSLIAAYRHLRKIDDAFRIAMVFPQYEASMVLFRKHRDEGEVYLMSRYEVGEEPHLAAKGLTALYTENDEAGLALQWAKIAYSHQDTTPGAKKTPDKANSSAQDQHF